MRLFLRMLCGLTDILKMTNRACGAVFPDSWFLVLDSYSTTCVFPSPIANKGVANSEDNQDTH